MPFKTMVFAQKIVWSASGFSGTLSACLSDIPEENIFSKQLQENGGVDRKNVWANSLTRMRFKTEVKVSQNMRQNVSVAKK